MHNFIDNKKGFSLVEFMIAISILAIGLLALVGLQSTSIRGNASSKNKNSAILLAEKKMEELKNTAFTSLSIGTTNDLNNPLTSSDGSGGTFNRSWTIQTYSGSANMKQITVTLSWTEGGIPHSTSLDTVVAN
jgi:type IV pilus assembly protein PilV